MTGAYENACTTALNDDVYNPEKLIIIIYV